MITSNIPKAEYCHIGGSGTWGCNFPEDVNFHGIKVLEADMEFDTPFGRTSPMKLFEISEEVTINHEKRLVLDATFHGFGGLSPYDGQPAERLFWVLQQAGVKYVLSDGTVAALNHLLEVGDVIIPSDLIDYTKRYYNLNKFTEDIIKMTDIVCPKLSSTLIDCAQTCFNRVFRRGVYGVYEPPRFETAAEARLLMMDGCDVLAHTMMPEAALTRAIGACYASIYYVSAYAEGTSQIDQANMEWGDTWSDKMGRVILQALCNHFAKQNDCACNSHRIKVPESIMRRINFKK